MEILMTTASVSLIAVALAGLISLADRFLNNYGRCVIDINDGERQVEVDGGSSLLMSLANERIFIPSACGGKATCGLCKLAVMTGAGPVLPTEEAHLSAEEIAANVRLSCQVKVKGNMSVIIPEELFNIREYIGTVEEIEDLTHDIKRLRIALPEGEEVSFKAGQYMQLYSKPYAKIREEVFRAYSIASVPSDRTHIELIIRLVPDGIATGYVHTTLQVGDEIRLSGPYGDFYLRGDVDEIIMIAGGSGLAPMRSIILDVIEKGLDLKMVFFFGAVTRRDLYYVEYFNELAAEHPNLRFIPALSAPAEGDNWEGETGLITEVVERHVPDAESREAYLCGSPGMINACLNVLGKKGFTNDQIFFDEF